MRELVIVGAGGHGRETLDIVEAINAVKPTWEFAGFVDDGKIIADRLERRRSFAAWHDRDPRRHRPALCHRHRLTGATSKAR